MNPPFRVRLCSHLPVYGGRTGLAVRATQQGKLVVHLNGAGAVWEGNRPTAWLDRDEYDVIEDAKGETMYEFTKSEIIIGFTKTVDSSELRLRFDTYQAACEAAGVIDNGGIKRVVIETAEGEARIWCNYVAWVRVVRFAATEASSEPEAT